MITKPTSDRTTTKVFEGSPPFMLGYVVRPLRDGTHGAWSRIASATLHDDGCGYDVELAATPLDGRIVLRMVSDLGEVPGEDVLPMANKFRN